ncbi:hypothetical protein PIB30_011260 [Stylosanthes scabra]|uniref:Uncharacterized protein n=1 Tax=Stylosanthes scabra TaxID=79078 RepID=A0ABU6U5M1_9FABA|nr:hypothetical protein [Stylosanthes scabra]
MVSLPMIIKYIIKPKKLVIITPTCAATAPNGPNDSLITPAYVVVSPECVNLIRNSTDISARIAVTNINKNAGTTPSTFNVAGTDIIPAPITLVATLNTAPDTVAGGTSSATSFAAGKSGTRAPAVGDILTENKLPEEEEEELAEEALLYR